MSVLLAILIGGVALLLAMRGLDRVVRKYVFLLFVGHVLGAVANVWLYDDYYGYGDIDRYTLYGKLLSQLLSTDFERFFPQVMRVVFHMENTLPFEELANGGATGTLCGITGLCMFVVGQDKLAVCVLFSTFSLVGQLGLYKVVREVTPTSEHMSGLITTLFVPSVVFWSSGIQKEAAAIGFLGILCWGAFSLTQRRLISGALQVTLSVIGLGTIKPYILFPFVISVGAWLFTVRGGKKRWTTRSIAYSVMAALTGAIGIFLLGKVFPQFSIEGVGETAAHLQGAGEGVRTANDSSFSIGDANETSLSGQAQFIPFGLFNSLFRPLLFEVRGPVILVAALEMTVVTVLCFIIVSRMRKQSVRDEIRTSPLLVFCLVFVVAFGGGVGLATTNMGTLSRYRMPMMPFYATALLLSYRRSRAVATVEEFEPSSIATL